MDPDQNLFAESGAAEHDANMPTDAGADAPTDDAAEGEQFADGHEESTADDHAEAATDDVSVDDGTAVELGKRPRSPAAQEAVEDEPSARLPPRSETQQAAVSSAAADETKDLEYYRTELTRTAMELKATQRQLATARAAADAATANAKAITHRCNVLEETQAELTAALQAPLWSAGNATPVPAVPAFDAAAAVNSAVAVATSRAQIAVLRLEAAARANEALRADLEAQTLRADAMREEAELWRAAAARALSERKPALSSASDARGTAADAVDMSAVFAAVDAAASEAKRFEGLLSAACGIMEEKVAVDAANEDWQAVLRELSATLKQFAEGYAGLLREANHARKASHAATSALAESEKRTQELTKALSDAALPSLVMRTYLARDSLRTVPPAVVSDFLPAAVARAAAASVAAPATATTGTHPAPDEVKFLRYMLQQQSVRADRLDASVRSLSSALQQMVAWATSTSRDQLLPLPPAQLLGSRSASSAVPDEAAQERTRLLESVCEQWARRAVVATQMAVDAGTRASAAVTRSNPLEDMRLSHITRLLAVERASARGLRQSLDAALGVATLAAAVLAQHWGPQQQQEGLDASALSAAVCSMQAVLAALSAERQEAVKEVNTVAQASHRELELLFQRHEVGHLRTIRFLQQGLQLADRAAISLLSPAQRPTGTAADRNTFVQRLTQIQAPLATLLPDGGAEDSVQNASEDGGGSVDEYAAAVATAVEQAAAKHLHAIRSATSAETAQLHRRVEVLETMERTEAARRVMELERQLANAQAQFDELEATARAEAEEAAALQRDAEHAHAQLRDAKHQLATGAAELERQQRSAAVAAEELEAAKTSLAEARAKVSEGMAAQAQLRLVKQEVSSLVKARQALEAQLEEMAKRLEHGDGEEDAEEGGEGDEGEGGGDDDDPISRASRMAVEAIHESTGGDPIGDGIDPTTSLR
jgi:ribosome biogenesis SPOUT family RNA methylase Rps3